MRTLLMLTLCLNFLPLMGCSGKSSSEPSNAEVPGAHPEHEHPEKGIEGGTLIELGEEEEYHVELLIDNKAGQVKINVLDATATKHVPVEKTQTVTFSGRQGGKEVSYPLTAKPAADDPEGESSRFTSTDKALGKYLSGHVHDVKLNLTIAGKPYKGIYNSH